MSTQRRAKQGGEVGANGDWYEGGKFIATTDHEKRAPMRQGKGTRKVEIEPWKWEVTPEAGIRSIYSQMGAGVFTGKLENGRWGLIAKDVTWLYYWKTEEAVAQAKAEYQALADRFNAGERWLVPVQADESVSGASVPVPSAGDSKPVRSAKERFIAERSLQGDAQSTPSATPRLRN